MATSGKKATSIFCFPGGFAKLHTPVVVVLLAFVAPAYGQGGDCTGPVDCAQVPLPFSIGNAQTRTAPFAFDVGPGILCYNTPGRILAGVVGELRCRGGRTSLIQEIGLYTDAPSIESICIGIIHSYPVTGTEVRAAGAACVPGIAESYMITDQAIAGLVGGWLQEHVLDPGVTPVSAAGIGSCFSSGSGNGFTLAVQLSDDSLLSFIAGQVWTVQIPNPIVATPDSFTNGPFSGVLVFDLTNAYIISGGVMTALPLQGNYQNHTRFTGGVTVTTDMGNETIWLAGGADVIQFAMCNGVMAACGTPPTIAMNIRPCPDIDAAAANWPLPGIRCEKQSGGGLGIPIGLPGGGGGGPPPPPPPPPPHPNIGDKEASVYAYAYTTLAGKPDTDGFNTSTIWNGGQPGTPGAPAVAKAEVAAGGDASTAEVTVSASYDEVNGKLEIDIDLGDSGNKLIHNLGHRARWYVNVNDPVVFENWDPNNDLAIVVKLDAGRSLPMHTDLDPASESRLKFSSTSDIPGLANLYDATVTATHDGVSTSLDVDFNSNPSLGLNDPDVEAAIAAAFKYNPGGGFYYIEADTTVAEVAIDIDSAGTYTVATEATAEGELWEEDLSGPPDTSDMWDFPAGCSTVASADLDFDGDVDLVDFAVYQQCLTGDGDPYGGFDFYKCSCIDYDDDLDIDLDDFAIFEVCAIGPHVPAVEGCDAPPPPDCDSWVFPRTAEHTTAIQGQAPEIDKLVYTIINGGASQRNYTIQEVDEIGSPHDYNWLSFDDYTPTVPSEDAASITATVDPVTPALGSGLYVAYLKITDNCSPQTEISRAITLNVGPDAPIITEGVSLKNHPGSGTWGLDILGSDAVECRQQGLEHVRLTFDRNIQAADGSVGVGDEVLLTLDGVPANSYITSASAYNDELDIYISSSIPDQSCVIITVREIGPASNPSSCFSYTNGVFPVRSLVGDVTRDGSVSNEDVNEVHDNYGSANSSNFRYDVDCDGFISATDESIVSGKVGNSVTCP